MAAVLCTTTLLPSFLPSSRFASLLPSSSSNPSFSPPPFLALRASRTDRVDPSPPPSLDVDVSVFRFTLGIPGFDDSELPRLIGVAFAALLLLNHFLTADVVAAAQMRSELVGFSNAILSISLPSIGMILNAHETINQADDLISQVVDNMSKEVPGNICG